MALISAILLASTPLCQAANWYSWHTCSDPVSETAFQNVWPLLWVCLPPRQNAGSLWGILLIPIQFFMIGSQTFLTALSSSLSAKASLERRWICSFTFSSSPLSHFRFYDGSRSFTSSLSLVCGLNSRSLPQQTPVSQWVNLFGFSSCVHWCYLKCTIWCILPVAAEAVFSALTSHPNKSSRND